MDPLTIKSLPKGTKVLIPLITPVIKQVDCSNDCIFPHHCVNGSLQVKAICFVQYYIPISHAQLFIIDIAIAVMHIVSLVPEDNIHTGTNYHLFGTQGSLTLYIAIAFYLNTSFLFSFICFTLQVLRGRGTRGGGRRHQPQRLVTATTGRRGE